MNKRPKRNSEDDTRSLCDRTTLIDEVLVRFSGTLVEIDLGRPLAVYRSSIRNTIKSCHLVNADHISERLRYYATIAVGKDWWESWSWNWDLLDLNLAKEIVSCYYYLLRIGSNSARDYINEVAWCYLVIKANEFAEDLTSTVPSLVAKTVRLAAMDHLVKLIGDSSYHSLVAPDLLRALLISDGMVKDLCLYLSDTMEVDGSYLPGVFRYIVPKITKESADAFWVMWNGRLWGHYLNTRWGHGTSRLEEHLAQTQILDYLISGVQR